LQEAIHTVLGPGPVVNVGRSAHGVLYAGLTNLSTGSSTTAALTKSSGTATRPAEDSFGYSVAMSADGTTALVCANSDNGVDAINGFFRGTAFVFHASSPGSWASSSSPVATLTAPDGDFLGSSIELSADGTTALIGSLGEMVYVFHASSEESWASSSSPVATLTGPSSRKGQGADVGGFGYSVALSADGTTALIGAWFFSPVPHRSAAYVYRASGEAAWASSSSPVATLTEGPSASTSEDGFGIGVALSADGTTALVAAPGAAEDIPGISLGSGKSAVYVFHATSEESWASSASPVATLAGPHGGNLGSSVALSADGTTALVGAPGGRVYVFHASSGASWASSASPVATLSGPSGGKGRFGYSLVLSPDGTTALVAAPDVSSGKGAVYVFHAPGEDRWEGTSAPVATLSALGSAAGEYFGSSLVLSADETTALVGAPGVVSPTATAYTGAAYVFHVTGDGSWASSASPRATLSEAPPVAGDHLGSSVAISADGTTALVAAPGVSSGKGAVYVFHASAEGSWASSASPQATLSYSRSAAGDNFGSLVAISADGTTALVAASSVNSDEGTGAAYVFQVKGERSWASSSAPAATLSEPAGAANSEEPDGFARSVAISADGTTALIGTIGLTGGEVWGIGQAYVFHASTEGPWTSSSSPAATLHEPPGLSLESFFGSLVAISADGTTALVSTDDETYVFHTPSEGRWTSSSSALAELTAPEGDAFPSSETISADGTTAVIGATGVSLSRGAAYVFKALVPRVTSVSPNSTSATTRTVGSLRPHVGIAGGARSPQGSM
jgi:hypothetical protein